MTALLVGVLLLSGWKVARASAVLAAAPQAGERTGLVERRNAPLRARTASPMAEIARAERALVFVYSPDCSVCHANMANWIDLVGELKGGPVSLYTVAPMDTPRTHAYWGQMTQHVRVITTTPAEVHTALGVDVTPMTLLVERGRVRGAAAGSLTAAGRGQLRAFARGEEW
jgi:hypothetical protein